MGEIKFGSKSKRCKLQRSLHGVSPRILRGSRWQGNTSGQKGRNSWGYLRCEASGRREEDAPRESIIKGVEHRGMKKVKGRIGVWGRKERSPIGEL